MSAPEPISVSRAKEWNDKVEEAYRFQTAGYRDETEYKFVKKTSHIERWPHNGYVKKLQRKDGNFYYYDKKRECSEKDVPKTKFYAY